MIDLHMHTNNSDGTDTTYELLKKAESLKLEIISITDHDCCQAYYDIKKDNLLDEYNGKIIIGCEFSTSYNQQFIEILGYGFDVENIVSFLKEHYDPLKLSINDKKLYQQLLTNLNQLDFKYDESNFKSYKWFSEKAIYKELIQYETNNEKLKHLGITCFSHFFRRGLANKKSPLFLDYYKYRPTLKQVLDIIHDNGGIAFLAHPYQYNVDNMDTFLNNLYKEYNIDGIECYHTTFSKKQSDYLLKFSQMNHLLISGGSDYHGNNKKLHEMGSGNGNLRLTQDIIKNWPIKYYN